MRSFYLAFPILNAPRSELPSPAKRAAPGLRAELSWTHYRLLLRVEKLTHQDIGQMDSYVRMFEAHAKPAGDNPTIGLILCSKKNEAVAKYSVLSDGRKIFAAKYPACLPTEEQLQRELERERRLLEKGANRDHRQKAGTVP